MTGKQERDREEGRSSSTTSAASKLSAVGKAASEILLQRRVQIVLAAAMVLSGVGWMIWPRKSGTAKVAQADHDVQHGKSTGQSKRVTPIRAARQPKDKEGPPASIAERMEAAEQTRQSGDASHTEQPPEQTTETDNSEAPTGTADATSSFQPQATSTNEDSGGNQDIPAAPSSFPVADSAPSESPASSHLDMQDPAPIPPSGGAFDPGASAGPVSVAGVSDAAPQEGSERAFSPTPPQPEKVSGGSSVGAAESSKGPIGRAAVSQGDAVPPLAGDSDSAHVGGPESSAVAGPLGSEAESSETARSQTGVEAVPTAPPVASLAAPRPLDPQTDAAHRGQAPVTASQNVEPAPVVRNEDLGQAPVGRPRDLGQAPVDAPTHLGQAPVGLPGEAGQVPVHQDPEQASVGFAENRGQAPVAAPQNPGQAPSSLRDLDPGRSQVRLGVGGNTTDGAVGPLEDGGAGQAMPVPGGQDFPGGLDRGAAPGSRSLGGASPFPAAPPVARLARDVPAPDAPVGAQTPAVTIQKLGPREVQVNRPATFTIVVRNTGTVPVHEVLVHDRVPKGTRLVKTTPPATPLEEGGLQWRIPTLDPGAQMRIAVEVIPESEGEIGSVATVSFAATASARAVSTRPVLKLAVSGPRTVLLGNTATLDIVVSNEGTGAAEGVVLQEDAPEVLRHEKGSKLEYAIGTMAPGETQRISLVLHAVAPGKGINRLTVRGAGGLLDQRELDIEVVAPKLIVGIEGPKRRFVDRKAEYRLQIGNTGTAAAKNVDIVLQLPKGMRFIEAGENGQYDSSRHTVRWNLVELPAHKQGETRLVVVPTEPGQQLLRLEATAPLCDRAVIEHAIAVEGLSELMFTIEDSADPIELGAETTYTVKIRNEGSRSDTNIQLTMAFPEGITAIEAVGATQAEPRENGLIVFAAIPELAAGQEVVYRVRAKGVSAGRHIVRARVTSDQSGVLVTKEEQTRVYQDR